MRLILPALALLLAVTASALAADLSIHSMVVGNRVLELVDTRQLTFKSDGEVVGCSISPNGQYVAYIRNTADSFTLTIASSKGGSAKSFTPPANPDAKSNDASIKPGRWFSRYPMVWSPNSRLLGLMCLYRKPMQIPESGSAADVRSKPESWLLLVQTDGQVKGSFPIGADEWGGAANCTAAAFSPDSTKLALSFSATKPGPWKNNQKNESTWVEVMDVSTGRGSVVYNGEDTLGPLVLSWTKDQSRILCDNEGSLVSLAVSGGTAETLYEYESEGDRPEHVWFSSDGAYLIHRPIGLDESSRTAVMDVGTGKDVVAVKFRKLEFERWLANGNLMLCAMPQEIKDDSEKRARRLYTLWLVSLAGRSMCVALDAGWKSATFSTDYRRMAYLLNGRVHVAELEWREPNLGEKLDANLKLTEEEEKRALVERSKQIAVALEQYSMDVKTGLPGSVADLQPYASEKTFVRPGTDQMIFKFLLDSDPWKVNEDGERYIPGETVLGEFDAGYSWKVVVYFNGDSKVVQK